MGCRFVCTTSEFAQKKDAKPVGGRGISAFSEDFLFLMRFFASDLNFSTDKKIPALGGDGDYTLRSDSRQSQPGSTLAHISNNLVDRILRESRRVDRNR